MNPIHFGVVMIVNLAIGFVTPPIGVNLFVASSLTDVPVMRIAKKAAPTSMDISCWHTNTYALLFGNQSPCMKY